MNVKELIMEWFSLEDPIDEKFKDKYISISEYNRINTLLKASEYSYEKLSIELEEKDKLVNTFNEIANENYRLYENLYNKFSDTLVEKKKQVTKSMKKRQPTKKCYPHTLLKHNISDSEIQDFITNTLKVSFDTPYYNNETKDYLKNRIFYTYNALQKYRNKRYKTDEQANGHQEYRETADEAWELMKQGKYSDCFVGDTKIIVYNVESGNIEFVKIKDINIDIHQALSYNHNTDKLEYKPILNKVNKGIKKVNKYKINKGGEVICTPNHKFAKFINNYKTIGYDEITNMRRTDNLHKTAPHFIPCVTKIPKHNLDELSPNKNYLKMCGIYLADGYKRKKYDNGFCLAGDTPQFVKENKEILDSLGFEYTFNNREKHKYYHILKGDLNLGRISYEKHLPFNYTKYTLESIKTLLKPYLERDSYIVNKPKKGNNRHWNIEDKYTMATVSENLSDNLHLCHYLLGKPLTKRLTDFQYPDAKRLPIWRLLTLDKPITYLETEFMKKSIKSEEYYGEEEVWDIEVAENHNFILADSGALVHNCDFWQVLFWVVLDYVVRQVNETNDLVYCADVIINGIGHAILTYNDNGIFVPVETTMNNKTYSDLIKGTSIRKSYQTTVMVVFDNKTEYQFE